MLSLALLIVAQSSFTVTNAVYRGPVDRPRGAKLVWHDEFSGASLDKRKWRYDTSHNKTGWFNNEKQYYAADRPQNVKVANGLLTITARKEDLDPRRYPDWGGQHYTSGKLVSRAAWTYGYYEVRAKLPCARGTWPAIWMLPQQMVKWPDDGEIDIMEQVGAEPNLIYSTLHTGLYNHTRKTQRSAQLAVPTSCTAFHTYQLDWRPDRILIGVDGKGILQVANDKPAEGKGAWPFDVPFDMILNLAMGGDWAAAKGMDDAALPQRMEVDYVRVWKAPSSSR
ncbi:glycoside hydrolase family 16 protein [Sphingomonas sp. ASV193]|uniref:glycoside hydrolase family 16 protein n=1 Tax=Sphingomonas sp. ASV193 TaxID=3144405 RepID=UPI0032E8EBD5